MMRLLFFSVLVFAGAGVTCGATDISDVSTILTVSASSEFNASTVMQKSFPDGLPAPIFHFDCTRTNGWEISASSRTVTKIPSLTGDRFLTTDQTAGHFTAWKATGATFIDNADDLCGMPVIDFGDIHLGSAEAPGLVFDGRSLAEGAAPSNILENIGCVVAVFGSHKSGGYLLGGGGGSPAGIGFLRGDDNLKSAPTELSYANILGKSPAEKAYYKGMIRQNGLPNIVDRANFSGGWQVIVFNAESDASLFATGVGLNDCRVSFASSYVHGGGQKIAEMIIFSKKLTKEQSLKIEAYLAAKWMKSSPRGWNGNAAISRLHAFANTPASDNTLESLGFNVGEGQTLSINRLDGGRASKNGPGIDKTGAGALAIDDMSEYDGVVRLKEGSLVFNRRQIPDALPPRRLAHFDASDSSSLVTVAENGTNFVIAWHGDADSRYKGERISLVPAQGCSRAFVRPGVFGEGMPAVDLGAFGNGSGAFSFVAGENSAQALSFKGISTIVAVIGAQEGGGHLGDSYFKRGATNPKYNDSLVVTSMQGSYFCLTEGAAFIDGVKRDMTKGYEHQGYQVLALQVPGFDFSTIGRKDKNSTAEAGGLRLAEIVVYNRELNETELRDASAYLMDKWMGRTAPGYAKKGGGRAVDVRKLEIRSAGTAVDVPANATVRIGALDTTEGFEKRGEGVLELPSVRDAGDYVVVKAGKVVAGYSADPVSKTEMAVEPAFHLDAASTNAMDIVTEKGIDYVSRWYDSSMRNYAFQTNAACRPFLRTDEKALLNGKPIVDFGASSTAGAYMNFCRGLNAVRSVFLVIGTQDDSNGEACILGSSRECPDVGSSTAINNLYDFARLNKSLFHAGYQSVAHVVDGDILTNGVVCTAAANLSRDYQIVEVHTLAGAHASALACDRIGQLSKSRGGQRLGEVLIYTRPLTARERTATRNYLRKKWFPAQELEELPEDKDGAVARPAGQIRRVAAMAVEGGLDVDAQEDIAAKKLNGTGVVRKSGAGALSLSDASGFTGTVCVASGTLKLTGEGPFVATDGFVADGRIFHADAMSGVETLTDGAGVKRVVKWTSRHDSAWTAVPGVEGVYPSLRSYVAGSGLSAVDMAPDSSECLRFCYNGELKHLERVCSVFWVIGSQNGGGYLLGGGTNKIGTTYFNFHRGYYTTNSTHPYTLDNIFDPSKPILNASSADSVLRANSVWRLNGKKIVPTESGLSGDWDLVSMMMTDSSFYTNAEGFAFDGRSFVSASTMHNTLKPVMGAQRLAEVIVYDRVLTEAERLQNESYLRGKWSVNSRSSDKNGMTVVLAAGTSLDCAGTSQYVAALRGSGTVVNGEISAGLLEADGAAAAWPEVDGVFAVSDGIKVEIKNLPEVSGRVKIKILRAREFAGTENLAGATLEGESVPAGLRARLGIDADGWLYLRLSPTGMTVVVK